MTQNPRPYQVDITIDAHRDAVWRALTEPDQLRQWFGWDYEGIDAEIEEIFVKDAQLDPPQRIAFGDGSAIELAADGSLTRVRAVLRGPVDGPEPDDLYDAIEEGWRTFFEQLRFLLETRPVGRRRTIYLTGVASGEQVLGLVGTATRVWHTSRYQRMIVCDAGQLVAVANQALLASDLANPVSITVSTYGLDDAAFASVRDDWAQRWRAVPAAKITTGAGEVVLG